MHLVIAWCIDSVIRCAATTLHLATRVGWRSLGKYRSSAYLERVELFMATNKIAEERRVTVFLSTVEPKTYGLLRNLVASSKPQDKSMLELMAASSKETFRTKAYCYCRAILFPSSESGSRREHCGLCG